MLLDLGRNIMDAVRRSWVADSEKPVTPTELMDFRSELSTALAAKGYNEAE